jgi:hypothetical protein
LDTPAVDVSSPRRVWRLIAHFQCAIKNRADPRVRSQAPDPGL